MTRFRSLHPGGPTVFFDEGIRAYPCLHSFSVQVLRLVFRRVAYSWRRCNRGVLRAAPLRRTREAPVPAVTDWCHRGRGVDHRRRHPAGQNQPGPVCRAVLVGRRLLQSLLQGGLFFRALSTSVVLSFDPDAHAAQSHWNLHKAVREFVDNIIYPDAQERELDGKRPSQSVLDKMA